MSRLYCPPNWFDDFKPFYSRPERPSIAMALRQYARSLDDPDMAPSYQQVLRAVQKHKHRIKELSGVAK